MSEILAIDSLKCMDLSEEMARVKNFILNSELIFIKLDAANEKMRKENYEYFGPLLSEKIHFFLSSVSKENSYYQSALYRDSHSPDNIYDRELNIVDYIVSKERIFELYLEGNIDILSHKNIQEEFAKKLKIIKMWRVDIEELENY